MAEKEGQLFDLAAYRKGVMPDAKGKAIAILSESCNTLAYRGGYDQDEYKPKNPQENDLWVTATIDLRNVPSTGSVFLDWLETALGRGQRYDLVIRIAGTKDGNRVDRVHDYELYTSAEVKRQIDWERQWASGAGDFYFQNYTGELNELFVDLSWAAAK
jgi:hypothetical protein